jgi:hypothetical protein
MNDVGEPNESASPLHRAPTADVTTLFNPQPVNAANSLLPHSTLENVESQEPGHVSEWGISSDLVTVVQDRRAEFGFSNSPSNCQSKSRNSIKIPNPKYGMPSSCRRPGRPKKSEQRPYSGVTKGQLKKSARRQFHNDSATRSRAKFNTLLDQLWDEVPEGQRVQALGENISRQLSRADKIEVVVSYVRIMRAKVKSVRSGTLYTNL